MNGSLEQFGRWLTATPLSQAVKHIEWMVPLLQTFHILAVATVMGTIVLLDLRVLGLGVRSQPVSALVRRYFQPLWIALGVLLVTGAVLIAAEPNRAIGNAAFLVKMGMLLVVIALTLLLRRRLQDDVTGGRWLAISSLVLWVGIIFAGRFIAYT